MPDEAVTAATLARWLGITDRMVRKLATAGTITRAGPNLFPLEASVRAVIEDLRSKLKTGGGEAVAATAAADRARLARAQAEHVEIKNAAARGALLDADAVEREWSKILAGVRARMLAVPSRAAQRLPHWTPHDAMTLDAEIRDALAELGGATSKG